MLTLSASLLILAFLFPLWLLYRKQRQGLLSRCNITTVPGNVITGNALQVLSNHGQFHAKCRREYGRIYGYYIGTRPQVAVTDLTLLSLIEVKHFDKFHTRAWNQVKGEVWSYPAYECSLVHENLSLERWRAMRTLLTRSFSSARLKESVALIDEALETMFKVIERERKTSEDVDMYVLAQGLTMDVVGRSSCGILTLAQEKPDDPFFVMIRKEFDHYLGLEYIPFASALLFPEFEFFLYWVRRVEYIILRALDKSITGVTYREIGKIISQRMASEKPPRKDLLQVMIEEIEKSASPESESKFTTEEACANANLFLSAGYETTATLLACMSHILVIYPDIQQRMRQEIQQFVETESEIGYNILQLPYLDAVINECLRVFPPITNFVNRKADEDFKYKDIVIPKGTCITVPIAQLHRDEEYWPEPNKFDPERFMGERKGEIKAMAYQPFGAGPRICIGMRLAQLEAKMALARLLTRYKFTASSRSALSLDQLEIEYKQHSLAPKNVFVKLTPL